jgi:type IV pilus assembly protein PilP
VIKTGFSRRRQLLVCFVLVLFGFGCEGKVTTKSTAPKPRPSAPVQPVALSPETTPKPVENIPVFSYNPEGRRDPFRSIITIGKTKGVRGLLPLQKVEINELKLIAIVWGGFGYHAMVQTPDGKGYTLKVGTAVGPNDGAVKRISQENVVVQENYTDIFGERKLRELVMELHPQKEGADEE